MLVRHAFSQVKLDESNSKLMTFNTPFGHYKFKWMPFDIISTSVIFQKVIAEIMGLQGVEAIMVDYLI